MQLSNFIISTKVELWAQRPLVGFKQYYQLLAYARKRSPHFNPKSYRTLVGSNGLEPSTSRLSGVCSNQLSYEPVVTAGYAVVGGG